MRWCTGRYADRVRSKRRLDPSCMVAGFQSGCHEKRGIENGHWQPFELPTPGRALPPSFPETHPLERHRSSMRRLEFRASTQSEPGANVVTVTEYLNQTVALMGELRIPVRDSFDPKLSFDIQVNDDQPLLSIEWIETAGYPSVRAKLREIPGHASIGYDNYTILMPNRYKESDRADDAIIHECVHFLQHNTAEEDRAYIYFAGNNLPAYLAQRVELEAHLVQVAYIFRDNPAHRDDRLSPSEQDFVNAELLNLRATGDVSRSLGAVLLCNSKRLI